MTQSLKTITDKWITIENLVVLLTGLWLFLVPFGKAELTPVFLLALVGLFQLIQTKGTFLRAIPARRFLLLIAFYTVPIIISMIDAPSLKQPLKVLLTTSIFLFSGLAILSVSSQEKVLKQITVLLVATVGFWLVDALIQAIFTYDIFGLAWERGRLSGPFLKKTQMGYYSGPFSAILLIFALQKKWKPLWLGALYLFTALIVMLNNSRGGIVMFGVVSAVFLWKAFVSPRKHKGWICAGIVLLGIAMAGGLYFGSDNIRSRADDTLLVFKGDKQSVDLALNYRLQLWEAACGVCKAHPINGVGARNFRVVGEGFWPQTGYDPLKVNTSYPHQYLMEYMVGTGLIGVTALLISIGLCIRWWSLASPHQKQLAFGFALTLAAIYFPINTHKACFSSELSISLWMTIALYIASVSHQEVSHEAD